MKTDIFTYAISKRNQIRFLYGLNEITLEPYYVMTERSGKKVLYGRPLNSSEVRKFEYKRISNIRVIKERRFSPIIPIISLVS